VVEDVDRPRSALERATVMVKEERSSALERAAKYEDEVEEVWRSTRAEASEVEKSQWLAS